MIKPKALTQGDTVAVISLSNGMLGEPGLIHKYHIAKERLENNWKLKVKAMPNALKGTDYIYRHPEARAEDLLEAFSDSEIKAVFCAIGGDDSIRLLPYIDYDILKNNPKIFTGFSDTTVNHFMLFKASIVSYYGLSVMTDLAEYVSINEYTASLIDSMFFNPQSNMYIPSSSFCCYDDERVWWDEKNTNMARTRHENSGYEIIQGRGKARGQLIGGCIDTFPQLIGTSLWPSAEQWKGKLLLIETSECDMSEDLLCWYLRNLWAQGVIDAINGIVVGKPAYKTKLESYKEVFRKVVGFEAGRSDLPIIYNVNIGHAYPNGILPLGLMYEINCDNKSLCLLEPATDKGQAISTDLF